MIRRFALILCLSVVAIVVFAPAVASPTVRKASAHLHSHTAMRGDVKYQERPRNAAPDDRRFSVRIQRGAPLKALAVRVNGNRVGTVVTNFSGKGSLSLRSKGKGAAKLPKGFPRIKTGDIVTVGPCAGVCFHDGDDATYEVAGETSIDSARYASRYLEQMPGDTLERTFEVVIENGEIDRDVPIFIDGVFWGAITTDASGNAMFRFRSKPNGVDDQPMPWDFPTLTIANVVQVGHAYITLAEIDHGGGWNGGDDDDSSDDDSSDDDSSDDNSSDDDSSDDNSSDDDSSDDNSSDDDSSDDNSSDDDSSDD